MPDSANQALIRAVGSALAAVADKGRAPAMQAYMKSAMPFRGVGAVPLRRALRAVFAAHPLSSAGAWRATVLALWRSARFREDRYAAIELSGDRAYAAFQDLLCLPIYEEMIVSGAWWDLVDAVAVHRIGPLLRRYPKRMKPVLRRWSRDANLWQRRTAILAQISFKRETDLELLYACIEPSLSSKEFFLRKAIGWALRQHAWCDPGEVQRYVFANADRLSPLSRREALKNVGPGRMA